MQIFRMSIPPCTNMKDPVEDFLATDLLRPADTGGIRGKLPQIFFVPAKIMLCSDNLF